MVLDQTIEGKLKSPNKFNLVVRFELISSFIAEKTFSNTVMCKRYVLFKDQQKKAYFFSL